MNTKRKYIIRTLIYLAAFFIGTSVLSAQDNSTCRTLFIKAFNDFRKATGDSYALSYTIETRLVSDKVNKEDINIRIKDSRTYMQTGSSRVYKDDKATVLIDESRKLIFITNVGDKSFTQARIGQMALMQDSLLNSEIELTCSSELLEGQSMKKITLDSENEIVASLGLKELNYWISDKRQEIKKISAIYSEDHYQLKSIEVVFERYDKSFAGDVFSGSALSKVYKSVGKVREAYTGYRVINKLTD